MSTLRVDSIRGQTADGTNRYVVQVVEKVSTESSAFTANSYVDHDSITITPVFSTSKMYLSFVGRVKYDNTLGNQERVRGGFRWSRNVGGSEVATHNHSTEQFQSKGISNNGSLEYAFTGTYTVFDTPATTSEITYKLQVINSQSDNNFNVSHGQIVIMEIAQ
tara:strand:- start:20 stop:508 length:489 start_codon:yes stop_codon:yes gene_type:complete